MAIRRWDPFTVLARLDDDFDQIVRRSFSAPQGWTQGWVPPIDMVSDGSDVVISFELPGLEPDDIDIEVHDGRLTISGERTSRQEEESEDHKVLVREFRYGSFRRDFVLPDGIDADAVSADYDKGVLKVRVSGVTKPPAQPRKVAVNRNKTITADSHEVDES